MNGNFPPIVISEASAGSGKTEILTRHFVSLLILSASNENSKGSSGILAITFTNDAAGEMKQRILEWLKKAALGNKEIIEKIREHISYLSEDKVKLTPQIISRLSFENIERILKDYHSLKISTIDSFVNSIAASSSLEMDLPPNYEIVTDVSVHIGLVVDEMLSGVGGKHSRDDKSNYHEETLFNDFLRSYFYMERDKIWNPRDAIYENVKFLYDEENHRGKKFKESGLDEKYIFTLREKIWEKCQKIALDPDIKSQTRDALLRKFSKLNKQKALEDFSEAQLKCLPESLLRDLKRYFQDYSAIRYDSYIKLYHYFCRIMEDYKKNRRIVFISDLNSSVASRLSSLEIPSVYFMLGDRVEHFLIDEFQDTSEIQWSNIMPLVENTLASGGSLFYVGDKKQSLYRWRGGRARLFDIVAEEVAPANFRRQRMYLNKNYRSAKAIVDFVNESFSIENLSSLGLSPQQLSSYEKVKQELPDNKKDMPPGSVKITKISAANIEELDDMIKGYIFSCINELLSISGGKFSYKDIAILVRKNSDVKKITQWLLAESIPVVSSTSMSLKENPVIIEIINFLKVLISPFDDVAFASVIGGKLFRNFSCIEENKIKDFLLKYRPSKRKKDTIDSLYDIFCVEYPRVHKSLFVRFKDLANYMMPYDLVSLYLAETDAFETMPDEEMFFLRLLEVINEWEGQHNAISSIKNFLDYWAEEAEDEYDDGGGRDIFEVKLPSGEEIDAVKVMTIHKAKGLGFPSVIIPYTPGLKQINKIVVEHTSPDGEPYLTLNYVIDAYSKVSDEIKSISSNEKLENMMDEINTLYVGLTRAKEHLRFALLNTRNLKNPFMEIFGETHSLDKIYNVSDTPQKVLLFKKSDEVKPKEQKTPSPLAWWQKLVSDKKTRRKEDIDLLIAPDKRLTEIERGIILHQILSEINGPLQSDDRKILRGMVTSLAQKILSGKSQGRSSTLPTVDEVVNKDIMPMFEIKDFAFWFSVKGENEKEIADRYGRIFRIDRIVEIDDNLYVIDYKTGEEYNNAHLEQMRHYGGLVSKIYGATKKNIFLYLAYLDEKRIIQV